MIEGFALAFFLFTMYFVSLYIYLYLCGLTFHLAAVMSRCVPEGELTFKEQDLAGGL